MSNLIDRINQQENIRSNEEKESEIVRLKRVIQDELPKYLKGKSLFGMTSSNELALIKESMRKVIDNEGTFLRNYEINEFIRPFILELTNLGILSEFMEDPSISEIMVNAFDEIWIEKDSKLVKTDLKFKNEEELLNLAERIARNVGRLIDPSHPYVDARLPDGSRVHIIIPPLSKKGVTITIRKFFKEKLLIEDLIKYKTLNQEMADFLSAAVHSKVNTIVSGGTGSGKTTTLNILSNFVPDDERIITVEDSAELQLNNEHFISLESKDANAEGKGEVTIQELVKNTLRMRPDRIILGEVRDHTAYDLLNAMSTGHEGSMCTVHSNDPDNCIERLTNLVLERGLGSTTNIIRTLIGDSVEIILQISKMNDDIRRITHISQVRRESGETYTENLFEFKTDGTKNSNGILNGDFVRTDVEIEEKMINKFILNGIDYTKFSAQKQ